MGRSGRRMLWADTERGQGRPTFPTAARTESSAPPATETSSQDSRRKVPGRAHTPGCRGNPAEFPTAQVFSSLTRYLGRLSRWTSRAPAPAHRHGGQRQGPAPAPAWPAAGVRAAASPEAPERPAAPPHPTPGQEAPLPRSLHPPPRSPDTLSPLGVRTTRRRAWAPWCLRHRRLPLSPASRRLAKQRSRSAAAEAAAQAQVPAAAAATSTSGRGSAHP